MKSTPTDESIKFVQQSTHFMRMYANAYLHEVCIKWCYWSKIFKKQTTAVKLTYTNSDLFNAAHTLCTHAYRHIRGVSSHVIKVMKLKQNIYHKKLRKTVHKDRGPYDGFFILR